MRSNIWLTWNNAVYNCVSWVPSGDKWISINVTNRSLTISISKKSRLLSLIFYTIMCQLQASSEDNKLLFNLRFSEQSVNLRIHFTYLRVFLEWQGWVTLTVLRMYSWLYSGIIPAGFGGQYVVSEITPEPDACKASKCLTTIVSLWPYWYILK